MSGNLHGSGGKWIGILVAAVALLAGVAVLIAVAARDGSSSSPARETIANARASASTRAPVTNATPMRSAHTTRGAAPQPAGKSGERANAAHATQNAARPTQLESLARLVSQSRPVSGSTGDVHVRSRPRVHRARHGRMRWVSTVERVARHEALPCTGPRAPSNFAVFAAGAEVAGLKLAGTARRCDSGAAADEAPANYVSYVYGNCTIPAGGTGCQEPLEVQTWPACQRSLADYTFEGKPMPYRELPSKEGAEVVEILFPYGSRIEVYSKTSTIVIFAHDPAVAQAAVESLSSQEVGEPPTTDPVELAAEPSGGLGPPAAGAIEGELKC